MLNSFLFHPDASLLIKSFFGCLRLLCGSRENHKKERKKAKQNERLEKEREKKRSKEIFKQIRRMYFERMKHLYKA